MSTLTTNYGMTKPSASENVSIATLNSNMDKIDTQMKANADDIAELGDLVNLGQTILTTTYANLNLSQPLSNFKKVYLLVLQQYGDAWYGTGQYVPVLAFNGTVNHYRFYCAAVSVVHCDVVYISDTSLQLCLTASVSPTTSLRIYGVK